MTKLQAEKIASLDPNDLRATIDKRVIHTGARVTAVDIAPLMLKRAQAKGQANPVPRLHRRGGEQSILSVGRASAAGSRRRRIDRYHDEGHS